MSCQPSPGGRVRRRLPVHSFRRAQPRLQPTSTKGEFETCPSHLPQRSPAATPDFSVAEPRFDTFIASNAYSALSPSFADLEEHPDHFTPHVTPVTRPVDGCDHSAMTSDQSVKHLQSPWLQHHDQDASFASSHNREPGVDAFRQRRLKRREHDGYQQFSVPRSESPINLNEDGMDLRLRPSVGSFWIDDSINPFINTFWLILWFVWNIFLNLLRYSWLTFRWCFIIFLLLLPIILLGLFVLQILYRGSQLSSYVVQTTCSSPSARFAIKMLGAEEICNLDTNSTRTKPKDFFGEDPFNTSAMNMTRSAIPSVIEIPHILRALDRNYISDMKIEMQILNEREGFVGGPAILDAIYKVEHHVQEGVKFSDDFHRNAKSTISYMGYLLSATAERLHFYTTQSAVPGSIPWFYFIISRNLPFIGTLASSQRLLLELQQSSGEIQPQIMDLVNGALQATSEVEEARKALDALAVLLGKESVSYEQLCNKRFYKNKPRVCLSLSIPVHHELVKNMTMHLVHSKKELYDIVEHLHGITSATNSTAININRISRKTQLEWTEAEIMATIRTVEDSCNSYFSETAHWHKFYLKKQEDIWQATRRKNRERKQD